MSEAVEYIESESVRSSGIYIESERIRSRVESTDRRRDS